MKRDMELCRKILMAVEDAPTTKIFDFHVDGYPDTTVKYNCDILQKEGFIDKVSENIIGNLTVGQLTWDGQDFLDKIRDDKIWNRVKKEICEKGLSLSFEIIKKIATTVAVTML